MNIGFRQKQKKFHNSRVETSVEWCRNRHSWPETPTQDHMNTDTISTHSCDLNLRDDLLRSGVQYMLTPVLSSTTLSDWNHRHSEQEHFTLLHKEAFTSSTSPEAKQPWMQPVLSKFFPGLMCPFLARGCVANSHVQQVGMELEVVILQQTFPMCFPKLKNCVCGLSISGTGLCYHNKVEVQSLMKE